MKFCQNCGAELNDAAKFCDKCGSKVASFEEPKKEQPIREGVVHKCPFCGEILPSNVGRCPTCGHEIRGREVLNSIKELTSKLDATDDDIKKIEIIKTFPIPSNKEDIMEFMFLASSNFDIKHYLSFKKQETIDSAWLTKIEQCYQKAQVLFTRSDDIAPIKRIYDDVHSKLATTSKNKFLLTFIGIGTIIVAAVGMVIASLMPKTADDKISTPAMIILYVFLAILAVGIIITVIGVRKKKTAKEFEEEKALKQEKDRQKAALKIEKERNKRR